MPNNPHSSWNRSSSRHVALKSAPPRAFDPVQRDIHDRLGSEPEREPAGQPPVGPPEILAAAQAHALRPEQGDTVTRALEPLGRPPPRVLQDADHPNDRCRQDRLAAGLIVEGNVAAHYRDLEGAARLGDAVDRLGELPENLRPP